MKPKAEHCRIEGNRIFCMHCKAEIIFSVPIEMRLLIAILKEFTKSHKSCPILQLPPPPPPPPPPEDRIITEGGYVKPPKCL